MRKRIVGLVVILLGLPLLGQAQGFRWRDNVINQAGRPVPATIRVCTEPATGSPCTPLASIFSDVGLASPKSNPFTADSLGYYDFAAAPGLYAIEISGFGITTKVVANVGMPLAPQENGSGRFRNFTSDPVSGLAEGQVWYRSDIDALRLRLTGSTISLGTGSGSGAMIYQTVSFSATPTFDLSAANLFAMTLTGNVTSSTITSASAGALAGFQLCQDATGGRTFVWPTSFLRPPTIASSPSACTDAMFFFDGTNWRIFNASGDNTLTRVLNDVRYAAQFSGGSSQAKLNAAVTDCGSAACIVEIPSTFDNTNFAFPTRASWTDNVAFFDMRQNDDWFSIGSYKAPFKYYAREAVDTPSTLDVIPTVQALMIHDLGGDNVAGGPKDQYYAFQGITVSGGRGEDHTFHGITVKYGSGDATGILATARSSGNCLEGGGECSVGGRFTASHSDSVLTATTGTVTDNGTTWTVNLSSPTNGQNVGVDRYVIITDAVTATFDPYIIGTVTSVDTAATPPTVTGSGTAWATTFGAGAHTDLCFSQNDDDAAGFKFVVPVRSIVSETSLTLDYNPQGADKTWSGDVNGSSYRIYRCGKVTSYTKAGALGADATQVIVAEGTTAWEQLDSVEIPLGWSFYGSGATSIVVNELPSFNTVGLTVTQSGDEPVRSILSASGKAYLGIILGNTWECWANNTNCSQGSTTGIYFANMPTLGIRFPNTGGSKTVLRSIDSTGGFTGNLDMIMGDASDCVDFQHSASGASTAVQSCPVDGSFVASIINARTYFTTRTSGSTPGSGEIRFRSGIGGVALTTIRNQANSADVTLFTYSTGDVLQLAQNATATQTLGNLIVGNSTGNDYLEATEEPTNPPCAASDYKLWANSVDLKWKKCQNGTITDLDVTPTLAWESLTNVSNTATTYNSDNTAETWTASFTASWTTGCQFCVKQQTGNPTGGQLALFQTADTDPFIAMFKGNGDFSAKIGIDSGSTTSQAADIAFLDRTVALWFVGRTSLNALRIAEGSQTRLHLIETLSGGGNSYVCGSTTCNHGFYNSSFSSAAFNINVGGTDAVLSSAGTITYLSDATVEKVIFSFESNFATGDQFLIRQQTGNPTGGTLAAIRAVDVDVTELLRLDHGGDANAVLAIDSGSTAPFGAFVNLYDRNTLRWQLGKETGGNNFLVYDAAVATIRYYAETGSHSNYTSGSTTTDHIFLNSTATERFRIKGNANTVAVGPSEDTKLTRISAGVLQIPKLQTETNCASSGGTCGSAPAGAVSIAAAATTVTVSTTAVTANSQIFIQEDSTLGTRLTVTCNTTTGRTYTVTTRTAATSFVITASAAPVTNPACLNYFIIN